MLNVAGKNTSWQNISCASSKKPPQNETCSLANDGVGGDLHNPTDFLKHHLQNLDVKPESRMLNLDKKTTL